MQKYWVAHCGAWKVVHGGIGKNRCVGDLKRGIGGNRCEGDIMGLPASGHKHTKNRGCRADST